MQRSLVGQATTRSTVSGGKAGIREGRVLSRVSHEQQGAGDVGGIVGGQKQDCGGDLVCPARALQRGALCGLGVILLDGLAGRCDAALMEREDRARADGRW